MKVDGEEIKTTDEHPFWVVGKGWTGASHLKSGDILKLENGKKVKVDEVWIEKLITPVKVYNFEVADWHTYYVSDAGVLVHNKCAKWADDTVKWSNHGYKHFPQKNMSWKNVIKSTKNGPVKYNLGTDIKVLEKMVWKKGIPVSNGKTWKVMEFNDIIGASGGAETKYMRVEMSGGTIHGHPITKAEYKKLIK